MPKKKKIKGKGMKGMSIKSGDKRPTKRCRHDCKGVEI